MSVSLLESGLFSVAALSKMFRIDASKTSILKYEERGIIPKAQRIMRGKSAYRVWQANDLPMIGEALGFLKKPSTPQTVSVFSLKGGTGKTTFAFQFARTLALHNIRTLVIGLDAQESITQTVNRTLNEDSEHQLGLFHILAEKVEATECICDTDLSTLKYLPETIELSVLDRFLKSKIRKEYIIKEQVIDPLIDSGDYDIIIFDCNPSWTDTVTSAIAGTDILVSPLGCDINSLKAANIFVGLLAEFQEEMRHSFKHFFIIPTLVETNKLSQHILAKYRLDYEELCTVGAIRRTIVVQEANVFGKTIMETAFKSNVYHDFVAVFQEINQIMSMQNTDITTDSTRPTAAFM